ncbi:MAG: hypothetical protein HYV60_13730 [Planctomycetia bacterium]|nr:hypothetical protein [Planctomycetia bacterium]
MSAIRVEFAFPPPIADVGVKPHRPTALSQVKQHTSEFVRRQRFGQPFGAKFPRVGCFEQFFEFRFVVGQQFVLDQLQSQQPLAFGPAAQGNPCTPSHAAFGVLWITSFFIRLINARREDAQAHLDLTGLMINPS